MKRYELRPDEVSKKAFNIYSNSDLVIWLHKGVYYVSDTGSASKYPLGSIEDVNEYLESFSDEE